MVQQSETSILEGMSQYWFNIISGIASILGCIATLYALRIRTQPQPQVRVLEWSRTLLLSMGIGLLTMGAVGFGTQQAPPKGLRDVYDFVHGTDGSIWNNGEYKFAEQSDGETEVTEINQIEVTSDYTRVYFKMTPLAGREYGDGVPGGGTVKRHPYFSVTSQGATPPMAGGNVSGTGTGAEPEPFSNIIIGTTNGVRYHLKGKKTQSKNEIISGYWEFPSLANKAGDILIWFDEIRLEDANQTNASLRLSIDTRGRGTALWVIIFAIGVVFSAFALRLDPVRSFKNRLIKEGKDINRQRSTELEKLLSGRRYEELSRDERDQYDNISTFYAHAARAVLGGIVGDPNEDPNRLRQ